MALVAHAAVANGLVLQDIGTSALPGQDGNVEYFLLATRVVSDRAPKIEEQDSAVEQLLARLWA